MLASILQLLTTPNLIVFTITLLVVYGIKNWLSHPSELPPMPCLPVPWLGHLILMRPSYVQAVMNWTEKMGDIYTIYHGRKVMIVIGSYDLIYEALVKKAALFSDRPTPVRAETKIGNTLGITMNSGPSWKEQRDVSMTILKNFGMGKNMLAEKISVVVQAYIKALSDFQEQPKNVAMLTNAALSNVICFILLGKYFDFDDPFLVRFLKIIEDMVSLPFKSVMLRMFPILRFLPGDYFGIKEYLKASEELTEKFSGHFIRKFKQEADDISADNYIKAYLRKMKKHLDAEEETYLDESNLRRHIDDLFLAGTETSSSTILWAYVYAMNFPEIQEKVYREIEEVVGIERLPNLYDKPKLNYVNAFILEVQRMGNVAPFGVPHTCTVTTKLGGYTIPKDVRITLNLMAVHKDPRKWKDPDVFRPDRFLDEHNNLVIPKAFIPFSVGKRACLGESLAKMELFLFLSAIFQTFEILPEDAASPPSLESVMFTTVVPKPFHVRFRKRSSY